MYLSIDLQPHCLHSGQPQAVCSVSQSSCFGVEPHPLSQPHPRLLWWPRPD